MQKIMGNFLPKFLIINGILISLCGLFYPPHHWTRGVGFHKILRGVCVYSGERQTKGQKVGGEERTASEFRILSIFCLSGNATKLHNFHP